MEKQPGQCFCGRYHASWWGKYVPAPSCIVKLEDFNHRMFVRMWKELEDEIQ